MEGEQWLWLAITFSMCVLTCRCNPLGGETRNGSVSSEGNGSETNESELERPLLEVSTGGVLADGRQNPGAASESLDSPTRPVF